MRIRYPRARGAARPATVLLAGRGMRSEGAAGTVGTMKPTQLLHEAGQSLWLDNITRALLDEGILARYVAEYSVTGLTSNPTIFDRAIRDGTAYDTDISARKASGATDEQVFFDLALADLRRAAGLFAPVHARTDDMDGWVSPEVSPPLLAHDTPAHRRSGREPAP